MVDDTDEMWWLKHEGETIEGEGEADIQGSGIYVTAYSKSPFVGALPWISGMAFASLLVLGQLPAISSIDMEVIGLGCLALFFLFVFSAVLLTNDELGVRISVNTEESLIDVAHRGLMTELKSKFRIKYGSSDHIHVQKAWLNGRALERSYLKLSEFHAGSVLTLEMGPEPSGWGTESRPPSFIS